MSTMELSQLYQAHGAARNAFTYNPFVPFKEAHIKTQSIGCQVLCRLNNLCYRSLNFLTFKRTVVSIPTNLSTTEESNNQTLGKKVLDFVMPINKINGKREFIIIPRFVDKFIGWTVEKLSRYFLTKSRIQIDGKSCRTYAKDIMKDIMDKILNENNELLGDLPYKVKVMASKQVNAFSFIGGKLVFMSGLIGIIDEFTEKKSIKDTKVYFADGTNVTINLEKVTRDDVIAYVMGHEMIHAASRHQAGSVCINILTSILGKRFEFLNLLFSRSCETEADIAGTYIAAKAGYNPLGALYMQQLFQELSQGSFDEILKNFTDFFSTHPSSETRKRALFAAINVIKPDAIKECIQKNNLEKRDQFDRLDQSIISAHDLTLL